MRPRSILFVELLGGLGDLLIALPAIHALSRSHPQARVTVLTFAPGDQLLATDPHVAEVVRAEQGPPEAQRDAVALLAARGFDLIVSDTRYGGIPETLSAAPAGMVVDDLWRRPPPDERIDLRFLALLTADGLIEPHLAGLEPRVVLTPAELARGRAVLPGAPAVLLPDAGMDIKRWAPEHFRALGGLLARDGRPVVAAARDPELAAAVIEGVPAARVLPQMGLRELAGALAAAGVCVAGDTGPARLAAAVGTPTVTLFGPSWAGRFGLRAAHSSLQSPLPCEVRNPANMTDQLCWYSGRCVFDDRRTCVDDLDVGTVHRAVRAVVQARAA